MRHDDSLATILLVSRLCADSVRPLKASEYWSLLDHISAGPDRGLGRGADTASGQQEPPSEGPGVELYEQPESPAASDERGSRGEGPGVLLGQSENQLVRDQGLPEELANRIAGLTERATALAFELDRLEQSGIKSLTVFDEHYPRLWLDRLRAKAPPLVHAAGAIDLLDTPGLGVVGSRDVSEAGGQVAKDLARSAARRGLPLVSGGARGVDQLSMDAALEAGGAVVGILAESLSRKLKRPDVRRAVHDGSTVMGTPYSPDAPFTAGNAMGRNKLIYAHTALTVVVASDVDTGGTWSGATEALKHGYGPVAVWRSDGQGPGNEALQQRGAIPVSSFDELDSLLDDPPAPQPEPRQPQTAHPDQQSLFATTPPQ